MKTRVLLEMGCNHQGDMDIAKTLIEHAHVLNAWGVKFQKRDIDAIPHEMRDKPRDPATSFGDTYYTHRKALEFTTEQALELKDFAEDMGLVFVESVFDEKSLRDMISIGVTHLKLPSQLFDNDEIVRPLVQHARNADVFIMRSTGMHVLREVVQASWLDFFDVTMYCRSLYPIVNIKDADLGFAHTLYAMLKPSQCGYSSHDKNGALIPYFVLLGATLVERHYTLDKSMKGSDHHTVSSDFEEMKLILESIEQMEEYMEVRNYTHLASPVEIATREFYMGKST